MNIYINTVLLILLIAASAFFAAAEVSFLALSLVRVHSLVEKQVKGALNIAELRREKRKVIIALLIGNNIVNIAASAIATDMALYLFGESGLAIAIGVMTFILLTLGDIAPKSFATSNGEKFMLFFGSLIFVFYKFSYPLVWIFDRINRLIPGVYSRATIIEQFTEDEVRTAAKLGAMHKGITEKEREMIEKVLEFKGRTVAEIMTPKSNVVCLEADLNILEAHKKALLSQYSRFPVLDGAGVVVGTVSIKILGRALYEKPDKFVLDAAWKPILINKKEIVANAFANLQSLGRNMAIVVDDRENFVGVVSLEDLLEELVGEIK
ncbi:MAG: CNNM domain-containing protein [Candidatus Micrarchaeota archaeon]